MNSLFKILLTLFFALPASAAAPADGRVKALMHTFLLEISKISDVLNSDEAFSSPQSKEKVSLALVTLEKRTQDTPEALQSTPGFRINFELLSDHIRKTKSAFEAGEYQYARMRLLGTPGLCTSCHTQTPQPKRFSSLSFLQGRIDHTSLDNANFLFVFRRYDEALKQYNGLLRNYPSSGLPSGALDDVYHKKLSIFARVKRDPGAAIEDLKTDLKNKGLPIDITRNLEIWIAAFEKWQKEKADPSNLSTADLISYVEKNMPTVTRNIAPSHPQAMTLLRLSGLLYERLYKEKNSSHTQELLYYLAQCERSLSPTYWYPLSEIYLKECIVRYPRGKFSAKCYEAYAQGMQERFFNKSIPEAVKNSLEAMKKYL